MMEYWKIVLDRYPGLDSGEVYVQADGEVIGAWSVDENGFFDFTPSGSDAPILTSPVLSSFCDHVFDWHNRQAVTPA